MRLFTPGDTLGIEQLLANRPILNPIFSSSEVLHVAALDKAIFVKYAQTPITNQEIDQIQSREYAQSLFSPRDVAPPGNNNNKV